MVFPGGGKGDIFRVDELGGFGVLSVCFESYV